MDAYGKEFETQKPSQKLYFKEHLGQVDLELEFVDGRVLSYAVSPLLATIILHFQDQRKTLNALAMSLTMYQHNGPSLI